MTSTSIYTPITPTYLYIKQHSITKKKYFGKTTRDPYTYNGSGPYWLKHIKKHGKEHIVTLWVSELYHDTSIVEVALKFSSDNDIVNSKEWGNLKPENGLDGGSVKHTEKAKAKMRKPKSEKHKANMRKPKSKEHKVKLRRPRGPHSEEQKAKQSVNMTGKKRGQYKKSGEPRKPHKPRSDKGNIRSEETKAKLRKPQPQITCPHCGKTGGEYAMKRWHFDNCKKTGAKPAYVL